MRFTLTIALASALMLASCGDSTPADTAPEPGLDAPDVAPGDADAGAAVDHGSGSGDQDGQGAGDGKGGGAKHD